MLRRRFLGRLAGVAGLAPLPALVSAGCAGSPLSPTPSPALDVRRFGAAGNGRVDDSQAFADAVRATAVDGILDVPDGVYLIDPRRSIALKDDMTLRLAPGAVLQALPVAEGVSAVVTVRDAANVTITGGTIAGERHQHLGTTGEWGMGIDVRGGTNVTIAGVTTRDCWGDGIYVGAGRQGESRQVTIRECTSSGNRRQGLSMTACIGALVADSRFEQTRGVAPQSGIDLEPNRPYAVRDVTLRGCVAVDNAGWGIVLSGETVSEVVVERCVMSGNQSFGGLAMIDAHHCVARDNRIERNLKGGVHLEGAVSNTFSGNVIRHNSQVESRLWPNVIVQFRARGNVFTSNAFSESERASAEPGPDISIRADCDATRVVGNTFRARSVDQHGRVTGGVINESPTTVLQDNATT